MVTAKPTNAREENKGPWERGRPLSPGVGSQGACREGVAENTQENSEGQGGQEWLDATEARCPPGGYLLGQGPG